MRLVLMLGAGAALLPLAVAALAAAVAVIYGATADRDPPEELYRAVPTYPPAEESRTRLERACWPVRLWHVPLGVRLAATTDEGRLLFASGATEAEALGRVCRLAQALGLLAPARERAEGMKRAEG
jgi:hypothetical protein